MKPKILYVNLNKPKSTLSNVNFKDYKQYAAHDMEHGGFAQYIDKDLYDKAVNELRLLGERKTLDSMGE